MHGTVSVESEYEKGSCFSFEIPQKIIDASPIIKLRDSSRYVCIGFFDNPLHAKHFQTIADSLGVPSTMMDNILIEGIPLIFDKWTEEFSGKERFVYIEQALVEKGIMEKYRMDSPKYEHVHFIILLDPYVNESKFDSIKYAIKIRRPLNILNLANVIPRDSLESFGESAADNRPGADVNFKAPTAKVLVVDDTPMNLKVADRFLKTMGITADCVSSGQEALDKIDKITYDLIFMDHMMPGIDGVDTTRIIRRFHPKLNSIPIIALTANAMEDARKMFLDEGMNDFIAKPIEMKILKSKVLQWLPPSKIEIVEN